MNSKQLREAYLRFFETHAHKRLPSASLIPASDPTLFFTNAGMVPFKDVFLGNESVGTQRATTSQKCMRVSGKHNDLEQVGRTRRHHTFFEMLGNFSFGDYFKKEAIAMAWTFLTDVVKIPADRLYVTVFRDDDEAETLWLAHVSKDRIFRRDEADNFWAMGETGPCGPCSEIHYDLTAKGKVTDADFDNDRLLEIWNLVFMQYNRSEDGTLTPLAKPSIDTGMGLERLASVVNGVAGNYETDLFAPVIAKVAALSGHRYQSHYGDTAKDDVSMRVIADHVRSAVFLIADGIQPSNEGRGYVLRRIVRRALRHGRLLGVTKPFFASLVGDVVAVMGEAYPEIVQAEAVVTRVLQEEENRFLETLDKGLSILNKWVATEKKTVPGDLVFKLYDTYGFPKDLTADIAGEQGLAIDEAGFETEMEAQRQRARQSWKGSGAEHVGEIYSELLQRGLSTDFVGYENVTASGRVLALIQDGVEVASVSGHDVAFQFVVDTTPFYGEGGGQVGDTGGAMTAAGAVITVETTTKPFPTLFVHHGSLKKGTVSVGDRLDMSVDQEFRDDIKRNHTATHLLHAALRTVLGDHARQAGSMVSADRLRFDFSHFSAVTDDELLRIEQIANAEVRRNAEVATREMAHADAVKEGALAFFGEKYGDRVRVVQVPGFSMELCGGTHVNRAGEIGLIKIISESGIASGVRRLEAVTGRGAEDYLRSIEQERAALAVRLKVSPKEVAEKVLRMADHIKQLEKEIVRVRQQGAAATDLTSHVSEHDGVKVLAAVIEGDVSDLRTMADQYKAKLGSGVICLGLQAEGKATIVVAVTADLTSRFNAGKLVGAVSAQLGGKGGGRPDLAQGGGPDVSKLQEIINNFKDFLK